MVKMTSPQPLFKYLGNNIWSIYKLHSRNKITCYIQRGTKKDYQESIQRVMALCMDEAEIWKCPTHPSKRRRTGICPTCLRDRLTTLCPNCANVRPCSCCPATTSSSVSLFSSSSSASGVGRVSNLLDGEPSFIRSRSLAIPFLRSRSRFTGNVEFSNQKPSTARAAGSKSSFLSIFKTNKSKKGEEDKENEEFAKTRNDFARMMNRSRSVSVPVSSNSGAGETRSSTKGRGWYFPSPMKAFRQSKTSRVVQERSPMIKV